MLRHIGELNKEYTCHGTEIVEPNLFTEGLREFRKGLVKLYQVNWPHTPCE